MKEPENKRGIPALVFSLSDTINRNQVQAIPGTNSSIWEIAIETPFNDFFRSMELSKFRVIIRHAIDKIKQIHGCEPLPIFPAMPVSVVVEMGKLWMNKADMPLIVYDYNKFFACID